MFDQLTSAKGSRWWTTGIGLGGEALLVAAMAVAPMIWPEVIPRVVFATALTPPGPPPAPAPKGNAMQPRAHATTVRQFRDNLLSEPAMIPAHPVMIVDPPPEVGAMGVPGGLDTGGVPGGIPGAGVIGSFVPEIRPTVVPRPPEPVKPSPAPVVPERLVLRGGEVNPAVAIFRPEPVYPPIARSMRVSGVVELIGVIGADGRMKELHIVSGHPLLAKAALDAVSRWVYKPTLLNGKPVEVEAPITVTFKLSN